MKKYSDKLRIGAAAAVAAASVWSSSALAISNSQFTQMCDAGVGLRSATVPGGGAGYAFDDGVSPQVCVVGPVPQTWDATLRATIRFILALPNAANNNLYLLSRCTGLGERYQGSFPKCNSVGQAPHVYAQTPIGAQNENQLINWVNQEINTNFP